MSKNYFKNLMVGELIIDLKKIKKEHGDVPVVLKHFDRESGEWYEKRVSEVGVICEDNEENPLDSNVVVLAAIYSSAGSIELDLEAAKDAADLAHTTIERAILD